MAKTINLHASALATGATAQFRELATFAGICQLLATEPGTTGYDTETITLYCAECKLTATLLSKTVGGTTTYYGLANLQRSEYASGDKRLLLQVTEPTTGDYHLTLDKGYLKA